MKTLNIDTDEILKEIRNFDLKFFGDKPWSIVMNPEDVRYLESNTGFTPILEYGQVNRIFDLIIVKDIEMEIGNFKINGKPRLKRW